MSESRAYSNSVTMAENPFQILLKTFNSFSRAVQTHLASVFSPPQQTNHHHGLSSTGNSNPLLVVSSRRDGSSLVQAMAAFPDSNTSTSKGKAATGLTKEELGRATWTLLHTLAAQYPDHPTRQQKRDVKELMAILSRIYPCKECADHFKEVLRANPVQAGSQDEFSKWLCHAHNVVNRSLGKLAFPCQRVNARWGKLECKDRACDLQGTSEPRI